MSLIPYYLQYLSEICEGTRQAPEGLALSEQDDLKKALQLQAGIAEMGIPAFVRACAAQDGTEIPQSEYDSFDPAEHNAVMHCEDESAGENTIVEVFQKGFRVGDKIIRFAMVKVAN